jgi:hypothetical protein
VVRVASCDDVVVDGSDEGDGIVSQVGIGVVSPDGTGDINNYTLWYDTTSDLLTKKLKKAGVNAKHADSLEFDFHPTSGGNGNLEIDSHKDPRFTLNASVLAPPADPVPFSANWWKTGYSNTTKMDTSFPELHFGFTGNTATLTTKKHSDLAGLIGGTSIAFNALVSYNSFPAGHMVVTVGP